MRPERFGPYLLARKIATGGTAEIFLARRDGAEGFARHIAIKRILPQYAESTSFVQLLLDEARLAAHLHHGHIVQIHDVGELDGQAYIAMEYLPGTDVGRLMNKAAERTRRVLVAHTDHELRKALIRHLKALDRDLEVVPAHDADEVSRRSADGAIDLAVVDGRLATLVNDRLASNHPELLRTVVVGKAPGLRPNSSTLVTEDGDPRILAELVDCCLRAPMPLDIALQIIRAVADGLDHAHTAVDYADNPLHIVHRDINPSNVLVSKSGTVKLVDFGIARATTTEEGRRKGFVGTYDYMSPEQTGGDPVDTRSDLFSLGTLIHCLVTGEHPYKGGDMFATMRAVREDPPPPLDARVPGIPALLVDIAARASEKDPEARYPSAEAMLADIEEVVRRGGINLSPKRLASYIRVIFGREVKQFSVTTMSMPAVKVDEQGNVTAVKARTSIDEVGRPIGDRSSVSQFAPILAVPAEPPPTLGPVKAIGAAEPAAAPSRPAEPSAPPAPRDPTAPPIPTDLGPPQRPPEPATMPQIRAVQQRFTPPPSAPPAEADDDGPTQVAPPSPEILAAIAAASRPRSGAPPPRDPEPVPMQAPAEHIARRLGAPAARAPASIGPMQPGPIRSRASYQRTPVGQRNSVHSLHSINAMGPPPSRRETAGDSAMRIVLGIVIGALVGLVALYIWWRTGA